MMPPRKALVPVAGLGTRFFPASHAMRKELFPVVGPDHSVRPLLHWQLRDLVRAGFDVIGLVVCPGAERTIRTYFEGPRGAFLDAIRTGPANEDELAEMRQILAALHFIEQPEPEGFGHAVYQARSFASGEPVLLCTGDHLFRGSCHREVVEAYAKGGGRSVSAVTPVHASRLYGYGTIGGERWESDSRMIEVAAILEKPSVESARARLHVSGLPPDTWLGWFGLHALAPSIFDILEELIRDGIRDNGEIQLTRAKQIQRERFGYLACEITASQRFDFGLPETFVSTLAAFAEAK